MIEIKHATIDDLEFIDKVVRMPYIFEAVKAGCLPEGFDRESLTAKEVLNNPNRYFLIPVVDGNQIGFFEFIPDNNITYEVHACVLKEYRGEIAIRAGREVGKWIFENTDCLKVITTIPECYPNVIKYVKALGFKMEGISKKSYMKNNKLIDRMMLGVEKE